MKMTLNFSTYLVPDVHANPTWNNVQACKQCLCKFYKCGVKLKTVPAYYIENAQKGLCKVKFAKFACARDKQYYMSELDSQTSN